MNPIGLYIHSPWCWQKCPYCDFNAYRKPELKEDLSLQSLLYLKALKRDLTQSLVHFPFIKKFQSVYLGGGTPSLMEPQRYWKEIFDFLNAHALLKTDSEVTMELSPKTSLDFVDQFIELGVNRFSVGVQSFNPKILKRLGREHSETQSHALLNHLKKYPNIRVNIDLIYGLAEQTPQDVHDDLKEALGFGFTHLSWYELMIEPNTIFAKFPEYKANEALLEEQESVSAALLSEWEHYEVSAYSLKKDYSQHNVLYWTYGDYLGVGAGAHSKITAKPYSLPLRFHKTRYPQNYISSPKSIWDDQQNIALDYLLGRLRLFRPITLTELRSHRMDRFLIWSWMQEIHSNLPGCFHYDAEQNAFCLLPLGQRSLSTLLEHFENFQKKTLTTRPL